MESPKKRFYEACKKFAIELDEIDNATPHQDTEPEWWLELSRLHNDVSRVIALEKSTDLKLK